MSIAFIAPYTSLHRKALDVIASGNYPAESYVGDMEDGVIAAGKAMAAGAKVIISRGGTARLIRQKLGVDPIEVGVSIPGILSYIHEQISDASRIAVVGHREFINVIDPLCRVLKRDYRSFEVSGGEIPSAKVIEQVLAWQPDIVLGDVVSVRLARKRGLRCHLIESGTSSIAEAFERALNMLSNINRHLSSAGKISAVLDCTHEGALLVTNAGVIEEVNRKGALLLGMERTDLINTDVHRVLASEDIRKAVSSGKNAGNIIVAHGEKPLLVTVVPTMPDKDTTGMVILFQPVAEIQKTECRIRRQLMDKGFYAKYTFSDILHQSPEMERLVAVAKEFSATTSNILIQGETGTGKELLAQSIHNEGALARGPFVAVNCAALPGTLLESELFGYAPGAFTGALRNGKTGLFELAHDGTLFLDEICEMDFYLQSRLLRAIQAREIMRVGDNRVIPVNVRIISATNKDPREEIAARRFRADLFYRLNVLDLSIPPLRHREGDASYIFLHFIGVYEARMRRRVRKPSQAFLRDLGRREWPGNVRELENLAEKYVTLNGLVDLDSHGHASPVPPKGRQGEAFSPPATSHTVPKPGPSDFFHGTLQEITSRAVRTVLDQESGNITRAAARLGVDRNTVRRWLDKG